MTDVDRPAFEIEGTLREAILTLQLGGGVTLDVMIELRARGFVTGGAPAKITTVGQAWADADANRVMRDATAWLKNAAYSIDD